ncbi:FAD-binding oxidoreductase [Aquibium sp. A9E412]|uniref:FAD-binding oxidoreductase n=1 Tax=Aquibium sp. A9E412 TaxID=2976767 RepID=UPI0025AFDECB|nr:FAD-binding oxidoreductase [Aquibium sp. A9E412]MDN2566167.1 FAD-binding oxidoreductase [Aquibium sp. A9E412]
MPHSVRILDTEMVTHNVRRFRLERPQGYDFTPGQATEVAIDRDGWREEKRPFTFTGLTDDPQLEFTIKIYPEHEGVTDALGRIAAGEALLIDAPWGTIRYKGPGTFIAGGAGLTPFIAILRDLARRGEIAGNRLVFSNKTEADIIMRETWEAMDGLDTLFVVTDEPESPLSGGPVDRDFLERHVADFGQRFYVCGPDKMVADITSALKALGADPDGLVFEE